jgi:hypothetical protein
MLFETFIKSMVIKSKIYYISSMYEEANPMVSEPTHQSSLPETPTGLVQSLERSQYQAKMGITIPLEVALIRLQESIARMANESTG